MLFIVINGRKFPRIAPAGRDVSRSREARPQSRFHPPSNLTLQNPAFATPSSGETDSSLIY